MSDGKRVRMYKTSGSFSHLLGNLTSIMERYIKDTMRPDYFKQTRVTTEVAFKDFKNIRRSLIQAEMPYLVIDPRFLSGEESEVLPQINWDRFIEIDHINDPKFYKMNSEFFLATEDQTLLLGYTFNRYKLSFRILMYVETQMQRMSLVNDLRSNFRFRHPFPIDRYTETLIPNSYIQHIADKLNMDIASNDFIKRLNQISAYPIVRLHRPATGKTEFFIMTETSLHLRLPDLPSEDTVMANRVERYSQIEFTIECELNVMNNFLLVTDDDIEDSSQVSTDYTFRFYLDVETPAPEKISNGFTLYSKVSMAFDGHDETVGFEDFLGRDILNEIRYIKEHGLLDQYAKIMIFKGRDLIPDGDSKIEVDMDKFEVTFKSPQEDISYTACIYFDLPYMATITKLINQDTLNSTMDDYRDQ